MGTGHRHSKSFVVVASPQSRLEGLAEAQDCSELTSNLNVRLTEGLFAFPCDHGY